MNKELLARIEKWLSVKVESDITELSPVDDKDMYELADIVEAMIAVKYGEYIDGGYPIDVRFANLQTHEKNMFAAPPRLGIDASLEDIEYAGRSATMNLTLAEQDTHTVINQLSYYIQRGIKNHE